MLHFVHESPADNASARRQQRRAARSHSARATHRETRQHETMQYQSKQLHTNPKALSAQSIYSEDMTSLRFIAAMPAGRKDPFMSFVRPFKPIEHFLLDYYVTVVVPFLRCQEDISIYQDSMTKRWVPFALREGGLLDAVFLLACRHMYLSHHNSQQQQQFVQLACQYKLSCTKSLRDAISNEVVFSDATVGTTLMLAYDELVASDISMYKNHIKAAVRMVNLNGGPQTLGLDGFMEHLISNLCAKHKLYDQT